MIESVIKKGTIQRKRIVNMASWTQTSNQVFTVTYPNSICVTLYTHIYIYNLCVKKFTIYSKFLPLHFKKTTTLLQYNSHTIKIAIFKYAIVVFSIITKLCNHHHSLILEYFITPKRNPIPTEVTSHPP